jgi:hypothetical protein
MIAAAPHVRGVVVPVLAQPGAKRAGIIGLMIESPSPHSKG